MQKLNIGRLKRLLETFLISKKIDIINQKKRKKQKWKMYKIKSKKQKQI